MLNKSYFTKVNKLILNNSAAFVILGATIGFILATIFAGKSAGEQGLIQSYILYFNGFSIHLHHWLWAGLLLFILEVTNMVKPFFKKYPISHLAEGILIGLIIQGVTYSDWYRVIYLT